MSSHRQDFIALLRAPCASLFAVSLAAGCASVQPPTPPSGVGVSVETDVAARAFDWLKARQQPDGSWSGEGAAQSRTAMTGLALLAFLAHGETPASERYGLTVQQALRFLVEEDWDGDRFRHADSGGYAHGIAALALCEAYGLTRIPAIKSVAEPAVARIMRGQQAAGGFNYGLIASSNRRDTCLGAWMAHALAIAHRAGLTVPDLDVAIRRAAAGIQLNYDARRRMFAYAADNSNPKRPITGKLSTTAAGVRALQMLGEGRSRAARSGAETLRSLAPDFASTAGAARHPLYVRYFAAHALQEMGGRDWTRWGGELAESYARAQQADGCWLAPENTTERGYGPTYATAISMMTLSVFSRRCLPSWQTSDDGTRPCADGAEVGMEVQ